MSYAAVVLMGPFGSGKTHLGHGLSAAGVADYIELEPTVYRLFSDGRELDLARATRFIRDHYHEQLAAGRGPVAFESTGVTQRPLLLEVLDRYEVALVRVVTPREVCLERIAVRHAGGDVESEVDNARRFFDFWTREIAPTYAFALEVSGTDEGAAVDAIASLLAD
jgi:hypothetical protein